MLGGGATIGTDGILVENDVVKLNANFNVKSTPLGTDSSKLAIYSDGKVAVDFTESPVVITAERLWSYSVPTGSQCKVTNFTIPNANDYDMFEIGALTWNGLFTTEKSNIVEIYNTTLRPGSNNPMKGLNVFTVMCKNLNFSAGTCGEMSLYYQQPLKADVTSDWSLFTASAGSPVTFYINGIKAK